MNELLNGEIIIPVRAATHTLGQFSRYVEAWLRRTKSKTVNARAFCRGQDAANAIQLHGNASMSASACESFSMVTPCCTKEQTSACQS